MTNTVNNAATNLMLNGGVHRRFHRHAGVTSLSPTDNFNCLFEPPVAISFNSSGSLSSSSSSSSSSSTCSSSNSSSSYWPSVQVVAEEPTTADRLEQNSDKFNQTPYRDDSYKNDSLSIQTRETLGKYYMPNIFWNDWILIENWFILCRTYIEVVAWTAQFVVQWGACRIWIV